MSELSRKALEMRNAIDMIEGALMGYGTLVDLPPCGMGQTIASASNRWSRLGKCAASVPRSPNAIGSSMPKSSIRRG